MSTIAYIDCPTGISGDMFLAACIDSGLSIELLSSELKKIDLDGYKIQTGKKNHNGLCGHYFKVLINEQHHHRRWEDIKKLIEQSQLTLPVKKKSISVFNTLALAEARVHGVAPEEVHFHEVGAIDSIVDIVGAAVALEALKIKKLYVSALPMGRGWVRAAHGQIPLPAPATLALLENCPVYPLAVDSELVTPTGAALAVALADGFSDWPRMTIQKVGFGAGGLDLHERPNILRLAIGEEAGNQVACGQLHNAGNEGHGLHGHSHGHDKTQHRPHTHDHNHDHVHHVKHHEQLNAPEQLSHKKNKQSAEKQKAEQKKNAQHG